MSDKIKNSKKDKASQNKKIIISNKTDKPDNVIEKEYLIERECESLEKSLPSFMRGFFSYIRSSLLPMSRLAYLHDIRFFCNYLINNTDLTAADDIKNITAAEFDRIKGADINIYLDYCRNYHVETEDSVHVYTNNNKTLSRKKSSVSVLFKYLYREEIISQNITDKFDPIRVQKASEREIKALQDNEVMIMLDAVSTGNNLTPKERQ